VRRQIERGDREKDEGDAPQGAEAQSVSEVGGRVGRASQYARKGPEVIFS
jgi:hypothetical protein